MVPRKDAPLILAIALAWGMWGLQDPLGDHESKDKAPDEIEGRRGVQKQDCKTPNFFRKSGGYKKNGRAISQDSWFCFAFSGIGLWKPEKECSGRWLKLRFSSSLKGNFFGKLEIQMPGFHCLLLDWNGSLMWVAEFLRLLVFPLIHLCWIWNFDTCLVSWEN